MILGTTPLDGQGKVPRMTVLAGVKGVGGWGGVGEVHISCQIEL